MTEPSLLIFCSCSCTIDILKPILSIIWRCMEWYTTYNLKNPKSSDLFFNIDPSFQNNAHLIQVNLLELTQII